MPPSVRMLCVQLCYLVYGMMLDDHFLFHPQALVCHGVQLRYLSFVCCVMTLSTFHHKQMFVKAFSYTDFHTGDA